MGPQITRAVGYAVAFASVLLFTGGCGEPESFEECLAEFLGEQNRNEPELKVIHQVCRSRFPPAPSEDLPPEAVSSLTGRAGRQNQGGRFGGTIYNPTSWTVTALEVRVSLKPQKGQRLLSLWTQRDHRVTDLLIAPKSAGSFSFALLDPSPGSELTWQILAAEGYGTDEAEEGMVEE